MSVTFDILFIVINPYREICCHDMDAQEIKMHEATCK